MAQAIVSCTVRKIGELLINEGVSLHGVSEEVGRLQAELKRMQCFLKDANNKQDQDERVRNWVAEIRDIAYDTEDVIDRFLLKVGDIGGLQGSIRKFTSIFTKGFHLHEMRKQIKAVQTRIGEISNSTQTYGIKFTGEGEGSSSASNEMQRRLRRSYPHAREEHVISLEGSTRELMEQLMTEDRLRVVSIVGMGGLGKTTLARKVYNHIDVKRHFDCSSWVFISQQYAERDVLSSILAQVSSSSSGRTEEEMFKGIYTRTEEELVKEIYNVLEKKRYWVILDGIWRHDTWDSLKPAFPNVKKGSKILLTTRNKEVALYADPWSSPIEPPFLTNEEGWELLCHKAFPREIVCKNSYLPEFEKLGRQMVRKCRGLPLAIVILGGLLATKDSLNEWKVVQRSIRAYLNKFQQHYGGVNWILALSYHELPLHLKPCFLYLGHFPEDSEIPRKQLIRMWIAEDFVTLPMSGEETMEDVAEQYFEELISRSLVQVRKRNKLGRGVRSYCIHDLVRDLCVSKAQEENFLGIIHTRENSSDLASTALKARRIALPPGGINLERYVSLMQGYLNLRSLLDFDKRWVEEDVGREKQKLIYNNCTLLRVLVLPQVYRCILPSNICNLIHLRYLRLSGTGCVLPGSIGNLRSLHILDVRGLYWKRIPNVIYKLVLLRHVLLPCLFQEDGWTCHIRVDTSRDLETLKLISAESIIENNGVLKLTNLRNLGIECKSLEEAAVILQSPIVRSGRLQSLRMIMSYGFQFPEFKALSYCHDLFKLRLCGEIPGDHYLDHLPANLAKLTLENSWLERDPMAMLEKLPNLRILYLISYSYVGTEMVCSAHGFPQLEFLELRSLPRLEEWRVEEGAMPTLGSLRIHGLQKLRMLPDGLRFVTTLHELEVTGMN